MNALFDLPDRKDTLSKNEIQADGHTCHFTFVCRRNPPLPSDQVKLEIQDFRMADIDAHYSQITIDSGRNHAFASYHGGGEFRHMSTSEYYSYGVTSNYQEARSSED